MENKIKNQNTSKLPEHLADLLQQTPSGIAKLIAVWDGLSTESQIQILKEINKGKLPDYFFTEKINIKALESENPYVRYLAARSFSFLSKRQCEKIYGTSESEKMEAIKKSIEDDPVPLVRYCLCEEKTFGFLDEELKSPEAFFELPQQTRLAKVRGLGGYGEEIAKLMLYAIDHHLKDGSVSEDEIFEILLDYVNRAEFKDYYKEDDLNYDGWGQYQKGKDIAALWHLIQKLPAASAHVLVANLPLGAGLQPKIPDDVLKNMNNSLLETLFWRNDVVLTELRKQIFFESSKKLEPDEEDEFERDSLRGAAIAYNFDLKYEEFAEILAKPVKKKVRDLIDLTSANDLSLCLHEAIHDALFNIKSDEVSPTSWEYAEFARRRFDRRLQNLQGYQREKEFRELRLYKLAKEGSHLPSDELQFLQESIVEGDTWATFIAFSSKWTKSSSEKTKIAAKHLPHIYEIDEDEKDDDTQIDGGNMMVSSQFHRETLKQFDELRAELKRQKYFLYAMIVLLIWLLISL